MSWEARAAALRIAQTSAFSRLLAGLERFEGGAPGAFVVLTYHRIDEPDPPSPLDPALISATPAEFERQMEWLAAERRPLSLAELLDARRGRAALPPGAVLVTFDDGYRDFARNAWPALRRHGVPATLFVPTAYPDGSVPEFRWDRLHRERTGATALASPVLGWAELRRLASEGLAVAPHSRTHPRLDRLPLERARDEVAGSRDDVARELGACPPAFAFPSGGHHAGLVRVLAEEGFELGFTTRRGGGRVGASGWLSLPRVNVGRRAGLPAIRAQLLVLQRRPLAGARL